MVTQTKRSDRISPTLRELHWLPVEKRIDHKILSLVYSCMNGTAPQYLGELIPRYLSVRHLRLHPQCKAGECRPRKQQKTVWSRSIFQCCSQTVEQSAHDWESILQRTLLRKTWRPTCSQRITFAQTAPVTFFFFFFDSAMSNAVVACIYVRALKIIFIIFPLLCYQTEFSCKRTSSLEDIVDIVIFWWYKPSLWPWHWR